MKQKFIPRIVFVTLTALILLSVISAASAGNVVPVTRLDDQTFAITISDFTPAACASLGLTNIEIDSGLFTGTNGDDLIFASNGADWIFGLGGNDCIVGGGGDDRIWGGGGTDVCIGGPGNDTFNQCETEIQ